MELAARGRLAKDERASIMFRDRMRRWSLFGARRTIMSYLCGAIVDHTLETGRAIVIVSGFRGHTSFIRADLMQLDYNYVQFGDNKAFTGQEISNYIVFKT